MPAAVTATRWPVRSETVHHLWTGWQDGRHMRRRLGLGRCPKTKRTGRLREASTFAGWKSTPIGAGALPEEDSVSAPMKTLEVGAAER